MILWIVPEYNWTYTANVKYVVEGLGVELLQSKLSSVISVTSGTSARGCLSFLSSLLFAMNSVLIPPGVEVIDIEHQSKEDIGSIILPTIKNLLYWGKVGNLL